MKNIVHWNRVEKQWTNHTYKSCTLSNKVLIKGDWNTEIKPQRKTNPRAWVVADHTQVLMNPPEEILKNFVKVERLIYNKHEMIFNHDKGTHLLFDEEGCFLVKEITQEKGGL